MRDDFSDKIKNILAKRAAYICSNKECRRLTVAPSDSDELNLVYIGCAAHITAAAEGGPRYDPQLSPEARSGINNGIYLCRSCSDMIDKNNGQDFPTETLNQWKLDHDKWIKDNLNKEFGGSIIEGIEQLKIELDEINQKNKKVLSVIDRNFELHKAIKTISLVIELHEEISISDQFTIEKCFAFFTHIQCVGIGLQPSFYLGNVFPVDEKTNFYILGKKMIPQPMEAGWSTNPDNILSQVSMGRGNIRKTFVSTIRANNFESLDRVIDLEGSQLKFYISEEFSKQIAKVFLVINNIIIELINLNELVTFPAKMKVSQLQVPEQIFCRFSEKLKDLEMLRFGRKGGRLRDVGREFPDIESTWFIKFYDPLLFMHSEMSELR